LHCSDVLHVLGSFPTRRSSDLVPWIEVVLYTIAPGSTTGAEPGFVYGIIVSLFLFCNIFALVHWLQDRPVGRFRNYLTGERATRSEEHTSELQSRENLVCRLLL